MLEREGMLFIRGQPGSCVREEFPEQVIAEAFGGAGPGRWSRMAGREGQCGLSTKKGRENGMERDPEAGRATVEIDERDRFWIFQRWTFPWLRNESDMGGVGKERYQRFLTCTTLYVVAFTA